MWNLKKWYKLTYLQNSLLWNRLTDIENKLMGTRGDSGGGEGGDKLGVCD